MNLQLVGWIREKNSGEPKRYILYTVASLPEGKNCIIGDAGLGFDSKRKWYAHLYDSGEVIETLGPHDSPQDALLGVEKHLNRAK